MVPGPYIYMIVHLVHCSVPLNTGYRDILH